MKEFYNIKTVDNVAVELNSYIMEGEFPRTLFFEDQADTEENISTEGVAYYPAAIMVNDAIYLLEGNPMPAEVDESAIIGYTESYIDTFPENNGETNFNRELGMPYA